MHYKEAIRQVSLLSLQLHFLCWTISGIYLDVILRNMIHYSYTVMHIKGQVICNCLQDNTIL
jgi:hypothetical protein